MTDAATIKSNDVALDGTKRRKAMFFEKVGSPKDIPFGKTLVLCKGDYFTTGKLVSKTETATGFSYLFEDDQNTDNVPGGITFEYWLLPQIS